MWECTCKDGAKVWAVQHKSMDKDTFWMFSAAGFGEILDGMAENERMEWRQFPIRVQMIREGEWWRLQEVALKIEGQMPDTSYTPTTVYWKRKAQELARQLINNGNVRCWDTETTGLDAGAEIISMGVVDEDLNAKLKLVLRPKHIERVTATQGVHGISREMLDSSAASTFRGMFDRIGRELHDKVWVGYNLRFDMQMLDQEIERISGLPILPCAVFDVMEMVSWFQCNWDESRGNWKSIKLVEAAEALGVAFEGDAHDAFADALTTMKLVHKMAEI